MSAIDLEVDMTSSCSPNITKGEEDMDISDSEDGDIGKEQKPESCSERNERLLNEMKYAFNVLNGIEKRNSRCSEHFFQSRVIVDVSIMVDIFNKGCQHLSCSGKSKVVNNKLEGGVLKVSWECSKGHTGCWASSQELGRHHGQVIYANPLLMSAGCLISGNNFDKLSLFCQFLGLGIISNSTYYRMQTLYIIPEVTRYWEQMKAEIWDILSEETVILCGDGRNDSPGHSAKYCMYALMEQSLDVIVDVEVVDKRETGGVSTNMEVLGLKRILERMVGNIIISEIVTDASAAVIALVRTMKGTVINW